MKVFGSTVVLFCWTNLLFVVFAASTKQNVLLIAVDDLRPDFLSYGQKQVITPNFERLAQHGMLFNRAYCQVAICSPSRTSLLTGLYPDSTGVWKIGPYFRDTMQHGSTVVTLPQYFKEQGYYASGAGKVFHPGKSSGGPTSSEGGADMPYSWSEPYFYCDQFYNGTVQSTKMQGWPNGTGCVQSDACVACLKAAGSLGGKPSWAKADCPANCYPDGLVADEIVRRLKSYENNLPENKPFFLAAGFKRPHLSWYAPSKYYDMYNVKDTVLAKHRTPPVGMPYDAFYHNGEIGGMDDITNIMNKTDAGWYSIPEYKQYELRRAYYASVTFMDSQLGRVIDALEQTGLINNTIIAFWGDHGYQLGEHGEWGKCTNFELGTRVPLLISVPDQKTKGMKTNALAELVDVFPTLVDAAGLPKMASLEGKSLMPFIRDPTTHSFEYARSQFERSTSNGVMGCSIRSDQYRYTEWVEFDYTSKKPLWDKVHGVELYDHKGDNEADFDAFENINLANDTKYADVVAHMHDWLVHNW